MTDRYLYYFSVSCPPPRTEPNGLAGRGPGARTRPSAGLRRRKSWSRRGKVTTFPLVERVQWPRLVPGGVPPASNLVSSLSNLDWSNRREHHLHLPDNWDGAAQLLVHHQPKDAHHDRPSLVQLHGALLELPLLRLLVPAKVEPPRRAAY